MERIWCLISVMVLRGRMKSIDCTTTVVNQLAYKSMRNNLSGLSSILNGAIYGKSTATHSNSPKLIMLTKLVTFSDCVVSEVQSVNHRSIS